MSLFRLVHLGIVFDWLIQEKYIVIVLTAI